MKSPVGFPPWNLAVAPCRGTLAWPFRAEREQETNFFRYLANSWQGILSPLPTFLEAQAAEGKRFFLRFKTPGTLSATVNRPCRLRKPGGQNLSSIHSPYTGLSPRHSRSLPTRRQWPSAHKTLGCGKGAGLLAGRSLATSAIILGRPETVRIPNSPQVSACRSSRLP